MIEYGLEAHGGGVMILKNPSPSGVMTVKTGGAMILKNQAPKWGHVSEKSHSVTLSLGFSALMASIDASFQV